MRSPSYRTYVPGQDVTVLIPRMMSISRLICSCQRLASHYFESSFLSVHRWPGAQGTTSALFIYLFAKVTTRDTLKRRSQITEKEDLWLLDMMRYFSGPINNTHWHQSIPVYTPSHRTSTSRMSISDGKTSSHFPERYSCSILTQPFLAEAERWKKWMWGTLARAHHPKIT